MANQADREARLNATVEIGGLPSIAEMKVTRDEARADRPILGVDLAFESVTDGNVRELSKDGERIEFLILTGTRVTDRAMLYLQKMPYLRQLSLRNTAITDVGCASLTQIQTLEDLSVSDTDITDDALKSLGTLTHLKALDIRNTATTDAGLASLEHLHRLKTLDVGETQITEEGIAALKEKLPSLTLVSGLAE